MSLKEVTLPHSLVKPDPWTFPDCSALEKVVFLSKDTVIGDYAFEGCERLPAESRMYELWRIFEFEKIQNGCLLARNLRKDDPSITELEIPLKFRSLTVRGISSNAFEGAVYLRAVAVPETVTAMEALKG